MNTLFKIITRKADWICHILSRNCLLKHVIEGKIEGIIEVTRIRGRRGKQIVMTLRKREDTGNRKTKH
jgi:hypothetical protein